MENISTHKASITKVGLVIILIGILYSLFLMNNQKRATNSNNASLASQATSPCSKLTYTHKNLYKVGKDIKFTNDDYTKILLTFGNSDELAKITGIKDKIMSEVLSPDQDLVAYITTVSHDGSSDELSDLRTVYLYSFKTKENTQVYQQQTTNFADDTGYTQGIVDLGFSHSENLLAIMANNGMYIYNLQTKQLNQEFLYPGNITGRGGIWAYDSPLFSLDDQQIRINRGYYEGQDQILYNLSSHTSKDLNYAIYGPGDYVFGWYNNKMILYSNSATGSGQLVSLVDPVTLHKDPIASGEFTLLSPLVTGNTVYFISDKSTPSGQKVCNNIQSIYEVSTDINSIDMVNLDSGMKKDIFSTDATDASGTTAGVEVLQIENVQLNGKAELILRLKNFAQGT
ncbi:MAG: hypothetical protein ACRDFB_04075, partial [Rhabdochlamydiaceae bacterium]